MKGPVGREMRLSTSNFVRMGAPLVSSGSFRLSISIRIILVMCMCMGCLRCRRSDPEDTLYISQQTNRESNTSQPIPHIHIYRNRANE